MLCPSVLINAWPSAFIASTVSYLFRSSLTKSHEAENSMPEGDPFHNPAFAPSLHAIMHIEIIRPFQRHRNVQEDHFDQNRRDGIKRQKCLSQVLIGPLEAKQTLDVITNSCSLVALCCIVAVDTRLPTGHLPPSASCRAL